jgi:hypothetical protein
MVEAALDLDDWDVERDAPWWSPAGVVAGSSVEFWGDGDGDATPVLWMAAGLFWTSAGLVWWPGRCVVGLGLGDGARPVREELR